MAVRQPGRMKGLSDQKVLQQVMLKSEIFWLRTVAGPLWTVRHHQALKEVRDAVPAGLLERVYRSCI